MRKILLAAFIPLFVAPISFAQDEEDASCMPPDKKILKILEKATSASAQDAALLFKDATDAAPENAMVFFEFAMYTFTEAQETAKMNVQKAEKQLKKAQGLFEKCLALCDNYHADVYFYLGGIHYMLGEKDAAKQQFQKFIDYKSTDATRYPEDYDKKKSEALKLIGQVKNDETSLGNPVPFNPTIVRNVSTALDEFFPTISPDNELMFFTRRVDKKDLGAITSKVVEEFTVASRTELNAPFNSGTPLPFHLMMALLTIMALLQFRLIIKK